jgi:hypothetical protein
MQPHERLKAKGRCSVVLRGRSVWLERFGRVRRGKGVVLTRYKRGQETPNLEELLRPTQRHGPDHLNHPMPPFEQLRQPSRSAGRPPRHCRIRVSTP